jgi:rubrerythrin
MTFSFAVKDLADALAAATNTLETAMGRYEADGIRDEELRGTMQEVGAALRQLRERLEGILAAHESKYDMVAFLNEGMQREYQGYQDYTKYVRHIQDADLARRVKAFGDSEAEHAQALAKKIRDLGGQPMVPAPELRADKAISVLEFLEENRKDEIETIAFYQKGLEQFDDPEFCWLVGQIKTDEEEHLKELDQLIGEYREKEISIRPEPGFRWFDQYMGEPGDRPWIE